MSLLKCGSWASSIPASAEIRLMFYTIEASRVTVVNVSTLLGVVVTDYASRFTHYGLRGD